MRDAKIARSAGASDVTSPGREHADADEHLTFRGRIFVPSKGYTVRTLLELRIRAGIGAILSKREWWAKWRRDDGAIRDKWLGEFERELITQTFQSSVGVWSHSNLDDAVSMLYNMLPEQGTDEEKRAYVDKVTATIPYSVIWHDDWWEEIDEDEDVNNERFESETSEEFTEGNEKMESYGMVTWYFELVAYNVKLKERPLEGWETHEAFELGTEEGVEKATEFVLAVHGGEVSKATFAEYAPEGDRREQIVDALWFHVDRILSELKEIRSCVTKTLEKVIEDNHLTTMTASEFVSSGPVQETWMSDVLIKDELKRKFTEEVAVLGNVPDEKKDWHPESNNQVLDLVHPSLFCCVFGTTKRVASAPHGASIVDRMQSMMFGATELVENEHRGSAKYQWIPSEFAVDSNGDVQILSYINNLHPVQHSSMYESITSIFKAFVPMFDRVLACLLNEQSPTPVMGLPNLYERETHDIPEHKPIPDIFQLQPESKPYSLRGKKVQVIVKIAEIHLTPENPSYPGGSWHVEGSDAEQIVATGIYYFGCHNISESKLSFRVIVQEPNYQQDDIVGMGAAYGLARDERLVQPLGSVTAVENRCIVFPNTLQHHVEPFELDDDSRPGVRSILAFFIVDPSKKIPSTSVIPPQQATWISSGQTPVLDELQRKATLPDGVVGKSVQELLGVGMTLEEAKEHRLGLMAERKPMADDEDDRELFFSLCEH